MTVERGDQPWLSSFVKDGVASWEKEMRGVTERVAEGWLAVFLLFWLGEMNRCRVRVLFSRERAAALADQRKGRGAPLL